MINCFCVLEIILPARRRTTWSSRGNSVKWGMCFAHSTNWKSCLSVAAHILPKAAVAEFTWGSSLHSTRFSASRTRSMGMSPCPPKKPKSRLSHLLHTSSPQYHLNTPLVASISISPFSLLRCLSSWTASRFMPICRHFW